jgi:ubiquinone biosynthesis protein
MILGAAKNAGRMRTIVGVFAKNGFQNVAEKIRLGRFLLERFAKPDIEKYTPAERMRMAFEELGPTFVKLGQVLATRPDLIPEDFVEEFKRLHDQVRPLPFSEVQGVLEAQFGRGLDQVFLSIDPQPLAAASIAQVHRANLIDGTEVVVKIQRPGIVEVIQDDISILYYLAGLLEKYVPETRLFNPIGIVDEFFKTLELETDFIIESNNIRRFQENFKNDPTVKIPRVYGEYSGKRVLVLEALQGIPLSQKAALEQEGIDRLKVMRAGIRCYFKQVFRDGLFHGDLHAGNLFILPESRIGLIDFGIVGRLNRRVRDAIANMFIALYTEDYERLAYEYIELAPYSDEISADEFAKDLQDLLAPYFGLTLKNVDLGRLLMDSTAVAAKHRLVLPSDLMLFFKSIVTVEGMANMIMQDFNLLDHALEFAEEIVRTKYSPERLREEALLFGRDVTSLMKGLPRQIKQLTRKVEHPDFAFRINLVELDELKRSVETSSNIIFLGLIIGSMLVGAALTMHLEKGPFLFQMPLVSALTYLFAVALGMVAFYNYIRK